MRRDGHGELDIDLATKANGQPGTPDFRYDYLVEHVQADGTVAYDACLTYANVTDNREHPILEGLEENEAFLFERYLPGIGRYLEEHGIAVPSEARSEYIAWNPLCPVYRFDLSKLQKVVENDGQERTDKHEAHGVCLLTRDI